MEATEAKEEQGGEEDVTIVSPTQPWKLPESQMRRLAASARTELGDSLNEIDGEEIREPMRVD